MIDIEKLEKELDEALSKETKESLTEWLKLKKRGTIRVSDDTQAFINPSGYPHAPYLVTWINAYEECWCEILTEEQFNNLIK